MHSSAKGTLEIAIRGSWIRRLLVLRSVLAWTLSWSAILALTMPLIAPVILTSFWILESKSWLGVPAFLLLFPYTKYIVRPITRTKLFRSLYRIRRVAKCRVLYHSSQKALEAPSRLAEVLDRNQPFRLYLRNFSLNLPDRKSTRLFPGAFIFSNDDEIIDLEERQYEVEILNEGCDVHSTFLFANTTDPTPPTSAYPLFAQSHEWFDLVEALIRDAADIVVLALEESPSLIQEIQCIHQAGRQEVTRLLAPEINSALAEQDLLKGFTLTLIDDPLQIVNPARSRFLKYMAANDVLSDQTIPLLDERNLDAAFTVAAFDAYGAKADEDLRQRSIFFGIVLAIFLYFLFFE